MRSNIDYTLYLVTDRELMAHDSIEECVEQAIMGGCTIIQLREKSASSREFYQTAVKVREITTRMGVPLIINDRADIAVAVDADGVHIGQTDLTYEAARRVVGSDKIVGVSISSLSMAIQAEKEGADYIGVGAMFATNTKSDTKPVSLDELRQIRGAVNIPIVAIGGINQSNASALKEAGADGLAVVSAIVAQKNAAIAAQEIKQIFQNASRKI